MLYSQINHTDLKASRLILGVDTFGTYIGEEESYKILDRFAEAGGNMIDTASVYADWYGGEKSASEKIMGRWFSERKNREKFIVSTKGGHYDLETLASRLSYECVRDDFEKSLINLQTDYIDIYWLHKDDLNQSPEELIEMFNRAVPEKGARYLGASNWSYDRIKAANEHAKKNSLRPIIASQIQYSIAKLNRVNYGIYAMDGEEYKKYSGGDIDVFGFTTQAKGFFAAMEKGGEAMLSDMKKQDYLNDYNTELLSRLKTLAAEKNTTVTALVLAALVSDSNVNTFALIGSKSLEQLNSSLASMEVSLTKEEKDFLFKNLPF